MRVRPLRSSRRSSAAVAIALGVAAAGLVAVTGAAPAQAASTWSSYAGTGTGAIPDGAGACAPGAPRVVTFTVAGMPVEPLGGVRLSGLLVSHTFVGDLTVTLTAPDSSSVVIFGRTGATDVLTNGDSSNLAGPYTFADAPSPNDWWAEAGAIATGGVIPSGRYRATALGGGAVNGGAHSITEAFAGVTDPNGMWTLTVVDRCASDVGSVDAATLQLQPSVEVGMGCLVFQSAVDLASGVWQDSSFDLSEAQATVSGAADAVGAAREVKATATSAQAAAETAATGATAALSAATAAVTKATAALKKAKKSKNGPAKKAKVAKASKALKAAKAKRKTAQTLAAATSTAVTTTGGALTLATQALTDRQQELGSAEQALDTAVGELAGAGEALADRQQELALCLDA